MSNDTDKDGEWTDVLSSITEEDIEEIREAKFYRSQYYDEPIYSIVFVKGYQLVVQSYPSGNCYIVPEHHSQKVFLENLDYLKSCAMIRWSPYNDLIDVTDEMIQEFQYSEELEKIKNLLRKVVREPLELSKNLW